VSARSQTILAVAGVVLVLLLVFVFFIRPRQGQLGEVRDQVQTEQDRTQQLQAELDRLTALKERAPQLQAALDRIRESVPEENDVPNFIFQVQDAANESGVGFVQISPELPEPPPEATSLASIRMTVGAQGGYFAVQDFIRRLYALDRAVRVDVMTMTGVEDDEEAAANGRVELQISARIFFELPANATAPAATTTPTTTTATTTTPAPATSPAPSPAS
jgi:Tfp pilus assembly protein PilO